MRKNLMLMVLMLGILVGLTMVVSAGTCTDSDGGLTYGTKGTMTVDLPADVGGVTIIEEDFCGGVTLLREYRCKINGQVVPSGSITSYSSQSWELYTCPNGCSDGACVSGGISGVGPAEATATSVVKKPTTRDSTASSSTASARKSSDSKTCPASWKETTSTEGTACCIPKKSERATGKFLGFMFRN